MHLVKENLKESQGRCKHYFDKKAKQKNIKIGDKVLVLLPTKNNKLVTQWKCLYAVVGEPYKNDFQIIIIISLFHQTKLIYKSTQLPTVKKNIFPT